MGCTVSIGCIACYFNFFFFIVVARIDILTLCNFSIYRESITEFCNVLLCNRVVMSESYVCIDLLYIDDNRCLILAHICKNLFALSLTDRSIFNRFYNEVFFFDTPTVCKILFNFYKYMFTIVINTACTVNSHLKKPFICYALFTCTHQVIVTSILIVIINIRIILVLIDCPCISMSNSYLIVFFSRISLTACPANSVVICIIVLISCRNVACAYKFKVNIRNNSVTGFEINFSVCIGGNCCFTVCFYYGNIKSAVLSDNCTQVKLRHDIERNFLCTAIIIFTLNRCDSCTGIHIVFIAYSVILAVHKFSFAVIYSDSRFYF